MLHTHFQRTSHSVYIRTADGDGLGVRGWGGGEEVTSDVTKMGVTKLGTGAEGEKGSTSAVTVQARYDTYGTGILCKVTINMKTTKRIPTRNG